MSRKTRLNRHSTDPCPSGEQCALVVFAKQPRPGAVKTRLCPPLTALEAAELYRCLLLDTLDLARRIDGATASICYQDDPGAAGYFATTAPRLPARPQQGADLGERMLNAFREAFAAGNRRVIIIGSDAPDLPAEYVKKAFAVLASGSDVVLGPAEDGGYYLIGLTRICEELFCGIAWSSPAVLEQSLARAAGAQRDVALLPLWHDIDTPADLERPELRRAGTPAVRTAAFLARLEAAS